MNDEIILRSVYGKVGQKYFIQPCADPKTKRFPNCVKSVDKDGDMILSESEKEKLSRGEVHFIKITHIFVIEDGFRLDLNDLVDAAIWEAIRFTDLIAPERSAKDSQGNLLIDGSQQRYGSAELYVERPGEVTKARVSRKQMVFKAQKYVYEDSESNRIKKCKVLGRDLSTAAPADVLDYMLEIAEKDHNRIINLYEDEDWKMELFILDALERGVMIKRNGAYQYNDRLIGTSTRAVIEMLKDVRYRSILNSMKKETYPEYLAKEELQKLEANATDNIPQFDEEDKTAKTVKNKK